MSIGTVPVRKLVDHTAEPSYEGLAECLDLEVAAAEEVVFRATQLAMLTTARCDRQLPAAVDEHLTALEDLGMLEMLRSTMVAELIPHHPDPTLDEVIDRAPAAMRARLEETGEKLRALVTEAEQLRRLIRDGASGALEDLAELSAATPQDEADPSPSEGSLWDRRG